MSTDPLEERYADLKELCKEVEPKLFEPLSWILKLNLELIPKEDIKNRETLKFSYELMYGNTKEALRIAQEKSSSDDTLAERFQSLLEMDPKLAKTQEISKKFFAYSKRRIEFIDKLGIKTY